jgi:hypothetical protein
MIVRFHYERRSGENGDGGDGPTEDDALCAAIVRRRDSAETFLARRIPYAHLDFPPLDLHFMYPKIDADRRARFVLR